MAALNTTTFAYALKKLYTKKAIQNLAHQASGSPFFAMVPKWENFGGANFVEPVVYADTTGGSHTFADALANKAASAGVAFTVTRVKDYSLASIDSETILASKGNERALLEAVKRETDSAINVCARNVAKGCYGNQKSTLGTVGSISSDTITLSDTSQISNFEVGMVLEAMSAADDALRTPDTGIISAIDRDAGTLVCAGAGAASVIATDTLHRDGDRVAAGDSIGIAGLGIQVPSGSPAALYGVTRTTDRTRLAGSATDATGLRIDEAIFKNAVRVAREGGRPNCVFLSFTKYEELINTLGSKLEYTSTESSAGVGFEGVKIHGPAGVLKVYPDLNCPSTVAYVLQLDTWTLRSLGSAPQILDLDGAKMLREGSADAYELRVAFFGNLSCCAPGYNGVVYNL